MTQILLIDDETAILTYLEKVITRLGYEVRTACDGISGYEEAKSPAVKLIISDLSMPGKISGINLVKELRALRPDCPIIIVSGHPTSDSLNEAKEFNVEFLTKPFEIPFLATLLKRLLPLDSGPGSTKAVPQ